MTSIYFRLSGEDLGAIIFVSVKCFGREREGGSHDEDDGDLHKPFC